MAALVTLQEAQDHLREWDENYESEVTLKSEMATDIVLDYITEEDPYWDTDTAPPLIKAAILLVLRSLYDDSDADPLSDSVVRVLQRYRDPSLA